MDTSINTDAKVMIPKLDNGMRLYRTDLSCVMDTLEKMFIYVDRDSQLLSYADDLYGSISDSYIMLVIAHLGICDIRSIMDGLSAIYRNNKSLSLMDFRDKDALRTRLKFLYKKGFVFRMNYTIQCDGVDKEGAVSLYSITKDAAAFVMRRLDRSIPSRNWIQALRVPEIVSWAACSRVGAFIAGRSYYFDKFLEGNFHSKITRKNTDIPCEMKFMKDGAAYYVAVYSAFLYFDKSVMSESDYKDYILDKMNFIYSYITKRTAKGKAQVVCVCENSKNLLEFARWSIQVPGFDTVLGNVYFTGEGMICNEKDEKEDLFLQLDIGSKIENGFTYRKAVPDFI